MTKNTLGKIMLKQKNAFTITYGLQRDESVNYLFIQTIKNNNKLCPLYFGDCVCEWMNVKQLKGNTFIKIRFIAQYKIELIGGTT